MKLRLLVLNLFIFCFSNSSELKFSIGSTSFNGSIPQKYTCDAKDGKNISPSLIISNVPSKAKSLLLLIEDPDARSVSQKTYIHLIAQIPTNVLTLNEGDLNEDTLKKGVKLIANDSKSLGYKGPCPPSGTHSYYFTLLALDKPFDISTSKDYLRDTWNKSSGFYKDNVKDIIGFSQIMGQYSKKESK